ncbi:response regulator [Caenispirillum salinarum]|uniref:response regulator n=1 Tax=Caenispirillum salinarum TaxID=859058 RepID=UPI00384AFD2F
MTGLDISRLSILVAEDSAFGRQLVRTTLKALNVSDIREAPDGAEALKMVRLRKPDIVLADWEMPHLDGVELTRLLRNAPDSPDPFLPVIMVTAHATKFHVVTARDAGANEYLIKPFSAASLFSRIRAVIERPRRYVRLKSYFGPDRRRRDDPAYRGPARRDDEQPPATGRDDALELEPVLSQEQVDRFYAGEGFDDPAETRQEQT